MNGPERSKLDLQWVKHVMIFFLNPSLLQDLKGGHLSFLSGTDLSVLSGTVGT